ncbi:two-component system, chemotaxis family, response regulator CheB [Halobacillus karajensis]|uniref:Protein-glutamate methylesterase/protein-glutamine glutaminase n=1 Tax=Halobacillus karajensis TaxID=195088 RepID=A0A024P1K6_9BACI|nr:chemotaxis response regulator protein-glutamate methylesterase [Halobacillus karajensis]CDQ19724.1 Chemotaxis response regulator protein-glutamate methylesterase [Halobacillus karajensis]CDQ22184.1 Chemotaxis response regulator protein-glutamate methylesterase [Halobacillus karajensis]CDQ28025.1 Chemotaxis response regulator protein-glutamate methylesterase [Halobacillus karajensis]SEH73225.1 two-component system, chemotaxis family, response regulator CheB [Halobacillus karajensis]
MKRVKVLVVDDSAFMRRILSDILKKEPRIDVVSTARNGKEGVEKIKGLTPDVVTLDIEMPVMGGLEALTYIMKQAPIPVVMVSSLTKEGAARTLEAIHLGAVDFIHKPSGAISIDMKSMDKEIIKKILTAGKARVSPFNDRLNRQVDLPEDIQTQGNIIAIGTSTGGPRALQQVLRTLPCNLPAPIVVVQHMPSGFTKSLAERLDKISEISVKEAGHMEELHNGVAYVAPGGYHMEIVQENKVLKIHLNQNPPVNGHRPSVNVMFSSLARLEKVTTTAVVMTGMGTDGLTGLLELKEMRKATFSIAEDESTCIVYGMPKAIHQSGLADEVQPLTNISQRIVQSLQRKRR